MMIMCLKRFYVRRPDIYIVIYPGGGEFKDIKGWFDNFEKITDIHSVETWGVFSKN